MARHEEEAGRAERVLDGVGERVRVVELRDVDDGDSLGGSHVD